MRHFYFPVFWAVSILFLCLIDTKELPSVTYLELMEFDKLVHIVLFGLLMLSCTVALRKQTRIAWAQKNAMVIALLFSIVYGSVIEVVQFFMVQDRTGELYDVLANGIGAFLGILFFRIIYGKELFRAS
ncbi:MAG: hypothetical protein CL833_11140 [Crocinitomicaceae bacterium]|nr:hypothetical protein [Crocinitomicaceae bacterium]